MTSKSHHKSHHSTKIPLYAETQLWSQRFQAWKTFNVMEPQLPKKADKTERWVDNVAYMPLDMGGFIGTHNDEIIKTLRNMRENFEDTKSFPNLLMIVGPSGSGKSSLCHAFMVELAMTMGLNSNEKRKKLYLWLNAKNFSADYNALWSTVSRFLATDIDRMVKVTFHIVVLDNADTIPPSAQQSLKRILEEFSGCAKFVLVGIDPSKIITSIQAKAIAVRTHSITERDALLVVLTLLQRIGVGYERQGMQEIFSHFAPVFSVSRILDFCQEVFVAYEFLALENVHKKLKKVVKPTVGPTDVLIPLDRCDICTLIPPCKHYDDAVLLENAKLRRKTLPRYKGGMTCPEFLRFGYCSFYNTNGHCSLDHPRNLHTVKDPVVRCPTCTIPWPCHHCAFSPARQHLFDFMEDLRGRLSRIKTLIAPDPPMSLVKHIDVVYPSYRHDLMRIHRIYVTPAKLEVLEETAQWVEHAVCTVTEEYVSKEEALRLAFGELAKTPMLFDYTKSLMAATNDDSSVGSLSLASSAGGGIEGDEESNAGGRVPSGFETAGDDSPRADTDND